MSKTLGVCKCGRIMPAEEFYSIHAIGLHCEYNPKAVEASMRKLKLAKERREKK